MSNNNPFPLGDDEVREHFRRQQQISSNRIALGAYQFNGNPPKLDRVEYSKLPIDSPQRAADMPSANPWRHYTYQHSYSLQEFWSDLKRVNLGLLLLSLLKVGMAVFALIGLRTVIEWMWK